MANEQLRERLARYIDQYKDDKESGVNMGTVGRARGYKSGAVYAYINAADSCRESGVEMDYNALFTQAQTINPTIGAGRI